MFTLLAEVARNSDSLTRYALGSALILHCIRAVLWSVSSAVDSPRHTIGLAAATAISSLVLSETHGSAAIALFDSILDPGWSAAGVWGRRAEGILDFAAEKREASTVTCGRSWNTAAQVALGSFLSDELGSIEAALRLPGAASLDVSLSRWDAVRIRAIHPQT